jgi:sugar O-acyltransferase (sialic acid O-acetyltransferase NeuD family)
MTPGRRLLLLGGGGHAAVVADAAIAAGWLLIGFLDDSLEASVPGLERLGGIDEGPGILERRGGGILVHAAHGEGHVRESWLAAYPPDAATTIAHPTACISRTAQIADGAFIGPHAILNARAWIGRGAIINSAAVIEHDVTIGDFTHVAPGSVMGGGAAVGAHSLVGIGSVVLPRVKIGRRVTLGGGAVAAKDIADGVTACGVPARVRSRRT